MSCGQHGSFFTRVGAAGRFCGYCKTEVPSTSMWPFPMRNGKPVRNPKPKKQIPALPDAPYMEAI